MGGGRGWWVRNEEGREGEERGEVEEEEKERRERERASERASDAGAAEEFLRLCFEIHDFDTHQHDAVRAAHANDRPVFRKSRGAEMKKEDVRQGLTERK